MIGGGPAAAVVFPREVRKRADADERVAAAKVERDAGRMTPLAFDKLRLRVHTETQGALAREFDQVHSVERAKRVGSLDDIISAGRCCARTLCARTEAAVEAWRASSP